MTDLVSFPELPWDGVEDWHVDVAVLGGGPAGLAAALRLRWMKSIPATPLTVALINSGPLGGLAGLGNSILTGPELAFPSGGLPELLQADLANWPLPILRQRACSISSRDGRLEVSLADGRLLQCLSLVVAVGMLELVNLPEFWGRGFSATFGSAANVHRVLRRTLTSSSSPVVIGGPGLADMAEDLAAMHPGCRLVVPDQTGRTAEGSRSDGPELIRGRLLEALGDSDGRLTGLRIEQAKEQRLLEADCIVAEFNSLELARADRLPGLPLTEQGFVQGSASDLRTPVPGLYGAGDCLGPPFSAVKALGQGVQAAFSAYRWAYSLKYGQEPSLFAYYGDKRVLSGPVEAEVDLGPESRPLRLLDECPQAEAERMWPLLDGKHGLEDLTEATGLSQAEIERTINGLIEARAVTFASR
jgi:thioredoxin reductase